MKEILSKPMIDYTIEYAKDCRLIDEIYVSTDSEEIAEYAKRKNVKVIMRPIELCGDVGIVEVLKHSLNNITYSNKITHVIALQVDHPDRTVNLTNLIQRTIDKDIVDTITIEPDGIRNGSIRILKKKDLMEGKISYSIMAVRDGCTNIHYQEDLQRAAENIKRRQKGRINA